MKQSLTKAMVSLFAGVFLLCICNTQASAIAGSNKYRAGQTVYHVEAKTSQSNNSTAKSARIYSTDSNGKNKKEIATIKNVDSIIYYKSGTLYLNASDDAVDIGIYSLNVKTGKSKKVIFNARLEDQHCAYGGYLITCKYSLSTARTLYSYNCVFSKKTTISKSVTAYSRSGNRIYYAQKLRGGSSNYTARIMTCSLSGREKTVKATLKNVKYIGTITSNYVYYQKSTGQFYRYSFLNKRNSSVPHSKQMHGTASLRVTDAFVGDAISSASYAIYANSKCTSQIRTITGEKAVFHIKSGKSNILSLYPGTYYVKATVVPQNYALDTTATKLVVTPGKSKTLALTLPRIYDLQTNYPDIPYNAPAQSGKTIYSSGCVPASLGNILRNYMNIPEATTLTMCNYALSVNACTIGGGTSISKLLAAASQKYGFTYTFTSSYAEVYAHIKSGKMALARTNTPPFAGSGHVMAVVGCSDTKLQIVDPYWIPGKREQYVSYGVDTTAVDGLINVTEEQAVSGINYYYLISKK